MKLIFAVMFFGMFSAQATEVKKFNQALIESVEKDIRTDNDDSFKKNSPSRAPASVETGNTDLPKNEKKLNKNFKQLGHPAW